jgi:hypothetical protein
VAPPVVGHVPSRSEDRSAVFRGVMVFMQKHMPPRRSSEAKNNLDSIF